MKKFVIEDNFWELFPEAKIGIVTCQEIDNMKKDRNTYEKLLLEAEQEALKKLEGMEFTENPIIAIWRQAYKKFHAKKGNRASIEALMKRIHKGEQIGTINPLVDLYNVISLKYGFPCGGEDMDQFVGNLKLTIADGTETFIPLGSQENKPPKEGEVVYKDDEGIICRCWNWREADRTKLTENTQNAFLCIETLGDNRHDDFQKALNELADLVRKHLKGSCKIEILDSVKKQIDIE